MLDSHHNSLENPISEEQSTQDEEFLAAYAEACRLFQLVIPRRPLTLFQAHYAILAILQICFLALTSRSTVAYRAVLMASGTLQLIASFFLAILSHYEHRRTIRPSFLLSIYLLLSLAFDIVRTRTQMLMDNHGLGGILIAAVVVKALVLITEARDKSGILLPEYAGSSSELRSGLFSRALFLWLTPLLFTGFRGVITPETLPAILETLSSESLATRVQTRWNNGKFRFWYSPCWLSNF